MNIIFFLIKLINTLIPKCENKMLFISRPDFSDNSLYLYKYIKSTNSKKDLSWMIYDKKTYDNLLNHHNEHTVFYLKSIRGLWEYARSKYIITSSSSLWQIKSPLQKQFDLWHGIPLKGVLYMGEPEIKNQMQAQNITLRFATSNLSKSLLSASLGLNAQKTKITGQPRTDVLYNESNYLSTLLDVQILNYSQVLLYMPTWRSGYKDNIDGLPLDNNENIFRMTDFNHQEFLKFLMDNNILLLIKLHPFEENIFKSEDLGENIKWVKNTDLISNNIGIYDILNEVDTLLTDYSSVYFDFLLTDKKIIFTPTDLEQYKNKRGFILEPYEFWAPGLKATDQKMLEKSILMEDTQSYIEKRRTVRNILFTHQDSNSSARVYKELKNYI